MTEFMREIGSEFWKRERQYIQQNESIYLSGRTALDVIVRDAVKSYSISSALLPAYCCHTMIEPFLGNGINVRFYDVYVNEENTLVAELPVPRKNEMLYIMKYFGDTDLCYEGEGRFLSEWIVSVEDLTHSCLAMGYSSQSDYWFTSYRKWFAVDGIAVAGKRGGKLEEASRGCNNVYLELRNQAFSLKQQFMDGNFVEKQEFLDRFGQAEYLLSKDYRDFGVGYKEIYELFRFLDERKKIRCTRRENAEVLIDGLSDINSINVFSDFQDNRKCPLFLPIIVEDEKRDPLRKYLISKDIYCPVHWPLSDQHKGISNRAEKLYKRELSLVCDQRYSGKDMERIVREIYKFMAYK